MSVRFGISSALVRREGRALAHGTRRLLRRALDDLNEAVRAALGLDPSQPKLVRELLVRAPLRTPAPPRRTRPRRWRPRRRVRPAHLTLVQ